MIHKVLKDLEYDESNYKREFVALSSFTEENQRYLKQITRFSILRH